MIGSVSALSQALVSDVSPLAEVASWQPPTGIVNLTSRGRVWAEGGDVGHHHAAIRAHVSSRQTLKAVAREIR
jgi:hypothetical protein